MPRKNNQTMDTKLRYSIHILILTGVLFSCTSKNNLSDAYGNFEATQVTVSSETAGKILSLQIQEGIDLDSGQVVALIDTTDLYLKKLQLLAQNKAIQVKTTQVYGQIDVLQQQKSNLQIEKIRITRLLSENAATQKQLDDINGAIEVIEKQMAQTRTQNASISGETDVVKTQINQVNASLAKCYIRNPTRGTVLNKFAESGEIAAPGRALYKIADLSLMELKIYISGKQLPNIKIGQEVEVLIDSQDNNKLKGTISWISQKAEFTPKIIQTKEERVNLVYGVIVKVKNDGRLKIAMPAEVNF